MSDSVHRLAVERRSEVDVAAEALASAVFASGIVKLTRPTLVTLARHVGVEPAEVLLAVRRHGDGKARSPRDVAVAAGVAPVVSLDGLRRPAPVKGPMPRAGRPGRARRRFA